MPIHHPILLRQGDLHEATTAWPFNALSRVGTIRRAVTGAKQPLTTVVKNTVGLPVQLHRYMGAAVQISLRLALKTNGKSAAMLAGVDDVKANGEAAFK